MSFLCCLCMCILKVRAIPYRSRSHGQFLLTLHPLQRGCLQSKTPAAFDKAVVFAELPVSAFAALYNTLVRLHLEYAIQACSPIVWSTFSG